MDFIAWFRAWLARHPLQSPDRALTDAYTHEVMAKVTALQQPAPAPIRVWLPWPRLALIAATAMAGVLVVVGTARRAQMQLTSAIDRDAQVVASLDELIPTTSAGSETNPDDLAQELQAADAFVIAQAAPDDERWVDQTLQLLQQLDEDPPENVTDTKGHPAESPDDMLKDLQQLDEKDLTAHS